MQAKHLTRRPTGIFVDCPDAATGRTRLDVFSTSEITAALADKVDGDYVATAITSAIATLVGAAPGTLDKIEELADAIGDDPNFAVTVAANIATVQDNLSTHDSDTSNPHGTTAAQVGAYTTTQADTAIATAVTTHANAADPHPQYATTTAVDTALSDKADISYVDGAVAGIVNGAPDQLNALNELADALGGDANFAATVAGQIGTAQAAAETAQDNLSTHEADTGNPHETTAVQVGALPIEGGTLTGPLAVAIVGGSGFSVASTGYVTHTAQSATSGDSVWMFSRGATTLAAVRYYTDSNVGFYIAGQQFCQVTGTTFLFCNSSTTTSTAEFRSNQNKFANTSAITGSSGTALPMQVIPTINQSGTAGYTGLLVNVTETTTGSGTKRLISGQVTSVELFGVDNTGTLVAGTVPDARLSSNVPLKGSANIFSQVQSAPDVTLSTQALGSVSGSRTINPDSGACVTLTATGDVTLSIFSSSSNRTRRLTLRFAQDATGSRQIILSGTNIKTPGGSFPQPVTTGLSVTMYEFVWNGTEWVLHNYVGGLA